MSESVWWKTVSRFTNLSSAFVTFAAILGFAVGVIEGWPWLTILLATVAIVLAAVVSTNFVLQIRDHSSLKLEIGPSEGPSIDLRLTVTNQGHSEKLHATCELLDVRGDPNEPRRGKYSLRWLESGLDVQEVPRGGSASLLIAEFTIRKHRGEYAELKLPEYRAGIEGEI